MKENPEPKPGQVWERPNGSQFVIERMAEYAGGYRAAVYYHAPGNRKPHFREISAHRLKRFYRYVGERPEA